MDVIVYPSSSISSKMQRQAVFCQENQESTEWCLILKSRFEKPFPKCCQQWNYAVVDFTGARPYGERYESEVWKRKQQQEICSYLHFITSSDPVFGTSGCLPWAQTSTYVLEESHGSIICGGCPSVQFVNVSFLCVPVHEDTTHMCLQTMLRTCLAGSYNGIQSCRRRFNSPTYKIE